MTNWQFNIDIYNHQRDLFQRSQECLQLNFSDFCAPGLRHLIHISLQQTCHEDITENTSFYVRNGYIITAHLHVFRTWYSARHFSYYNKCHLTSSVAARFSRHGMPPPVCNPDLWPFDLETGVRVASKVGNLHSKSGPAKPLGSRIIRYVCVVAMDRQTDRRTDGRTKATLIASFPRVGGIITASQYRWLEWPFL